MNEFSNSSRRLVFVHGPWQLLVATAAVRQASASASRSGGPTESILVIFPLDTGPSTPELREVIERLAGATWTWDRVVTVDQPLRDLSAEGVAEAIASLRSRVGASRADEIWLDCLWGGIEKVAAEAFPNARIMLYEDGLHTFVEHEDHHLSIGRFLNEPKRTYRAIRARLAQRRFPDRLKRWSLLRRHLDRVGGSYLWTDQVIPVPAYQRHLPRVRLQANVLRETIRDGSCVAPLPSVASEMDRSEEPRALVLGQCFSNYGDLPRDEELSCYRETVITLRKAGFSVLWKEHPRTREPFLQALASEVEGIVAMPELGPWPVELFAERLRLSCCAAVSSTSLFSFPLLFGLPSYTMMTDAIQALFRYPNDQMARFVVASVPPVTRAVSLSKETQTVTTISDPSGLASPDPGHRDAIDGQPGARLGV